MSRVYTTSARPVAHIDDSENLTYTSVDVVGEEVAIVQRNAPVLYGSAARRCKINLRTDDLLDALRQLGVI